MNTQEQKIYFRIFFSAYLLGQTEHDRFQAGDLVTILTPERPRNRGSTPGKGKRFFSSPKPPDRSVSHPASYIVRTGEFFLGVKLSGLETDHLSPASAGFKIEWVYSSTPPIYLYSAHRENFNCTIIRASQFLIRHSIYDTLICS
jgi:hypothetical protein